MSADKMHSLTITMRFFLSRWWTTVMNTDGSFAYADVEPWVSHSENDPRCYSGDTGVVLNLFLQFCPVSNSTLYRKNCRANTRHYLYLLGPCCYSSLLDLFLIWNFVIISQQLQSSQPTTGSFAHFKIFPVSRRHAMETVLYSGSLIFKIFHLIQFIKDYALILKIFEYSATHRNKNHSFFAHSLTLNPYAVTSCEHNDSK